MGMKISCLHVLYALAPWKVLWYVPKVSHENQRFIGQLSLSLIPGGAQVKMKNISWGMSQGTSSWELEGLRHWGLGSALDWLCFCRPNLKMTTQILAKDMQHFTVDDAALIGT